MAFLDMLAADSSLLINTDEFASSIVHRDPGGTETLIEAVVYEQRTEQRESEGINTIVRTSACSFKTTDLPNVNLRSVVLIDGVEWAISRLLDRNDHITSIELMRHELHEHNRAGYRRP